MKNSELAKKYEDYIVALRRWFHENPELSRQEFGTLKRIMEELDALGADYVEIPDGGILVTVKGGKAGGKSVLLRADVDALGVTENEDNLKKGARTCISKNPGFMHACGHDAHIAMMLGAIRILLEKRDEIEGTVYCVFERGEEYMSMYKNVLKYLNDNGIEPDSSWGIHVQANNDSGKIYINDGGMMSGFSSFQIKLIGKGGHGSRPDESNNPIDAFCALYQGMHEIRMRKISPFSTVAWSVGKLAAGVTGNVIPDELEFSGSIRFIDREDGKIFVAEMQKLVKTVCENYGVEWSGRITPPSFGVVNYAPCAQLARKAIAEDMGEEHVDFCDPWMGSESFANYLCLWPGVLAFVGIRNDEKGCGAAHHNRLFDVDEDSLYIGAASAATYAIEFLKSDIDTSDAKVKGGYRGLLRVLEDRQNLKDLYGEEL